MCIRDRFALNSLKNNFFFVGFVVTVFVGKEPHIRALGHQNTVTHDQNSQWSSHFWPLIKHFTGISFAVSVGIFQNKDAVTFGVGGISRNGRAVVVGFEHPYPPPMVDVDIGGVGNQGFGGKKIGF